MKKLGKFGSVISAVALAATLSFATAGAAEANAGFRTVKVYASTVTRAQEICRYAHNGSLYVNPRTGTYGQPIRYQDSFGRYYWICAY